MIACILNFEQIICSDQGVVNTRKRIGTNAKADHQGGKLLGLNVFCFFVSVYFPNFALVGYNLPHKYNKFPHINSAIIAALYNLQRFRPESHIPPRNGSYDHSLSYKPLGC